MQNGELYTWGRGVGGALGLGRSEGVGTPKRVEFNEVLMPFIVEVSAGGDHTI